MCHVVNAGYSGMETIIPNNTDYNTLDKVTNALLRSMMMGSASYQSETHKKSLTTKQVRQHKLNLESED